MRILAKDLNKHLGKNVNIAGWLHKKRALGGIMFLLVRDRSGLVQVKLEDRQEEEKVRGMQIGSVLEIAGKAYKDQRAPGGAEIHSPSINVLVPVTEEPPIEIDKPLGHKPDNLDTLFEYRPIGLRNLQEAATFKIQAAITTALRNYFNANEFIEIHTPKLVAGATEGGAEVFSLDYFGSQATLAQSPQFYKQIMVGVFERVYEIAPVFRAEPSATTRHMSEYTSIDAEMAFINISELETVLSELLRQAAEYIWKNCRQELDLLGAVKPKLPKKIPVISLQKVHQLYSKASGNKTIGEKDLRPDEERWVCEYSLKEHNSDAVFISDWPASDMKFYHKLQPGSNDTADRIDLLFRGVEIATGSMRENNYDTLTAQLKKLVKASPDSPGFRHFIMAMRSGMPPHGGFGMGLERLTEKIIGLNNVKEATLFPRDMNRLSP